MRAEVLDKEDGCHLLLSSLAISLAARWLSKNKLHMHKLHMHTTQGNPFCMVHPPWNPTETIERVSSRVVLED